MDDHLETSCQAHIYKPAKHFVVKWNEDLTGLAILFKCFAIGSHNVAPLARSHHNIHEII